MLLRSSLILSLGCVLSLSTITPKAHAQSGPFSDPIPYCPNVVRVYVDAATGCDPLDAFGIFDPTSAASLARINNPSAPFQTIQAGIDTCLEGVIALYGTDPTATGVVFCMPGVYGPTAVQTRVDTLPINMKDRVSVQGMGARQTIIRGGGSTNSAVYWPSMECCGDQEAKEVLVDFSFETPFFGQGYPWTESGNSEEMLDGFSFQGGQVQVLYESETPDSLGRISNCIFDLRAEEEEGPEVGILTVQVYDYTAHTYNPIKMKVFNNTFVFAEVSAQNDLELRPVRTALSWTVGILDVNFPICDYENLREICDPVNIYLDGGDTDIHLRGVGLPSIQNNLFRTLPGEPARQVMLGIGASATAIQANGGTVTGDTNAFVSNHVGGNVAFDTSVTPNVPKLFSRLPASGAPTPKVDLLIPSNDPAFVGELIAPVLASTPSNLKTYRDWRLTPSSSDPLDRSNVLQDQGSSPNLASPFLFVAENGTTYSEPFCSELWSFDWDGEGFGNRRRVREVDIGFDEVHLMLSTGSWANDSVSHHNPDLVIDPNTTARGGLRRVLVFPSFASASGNTLTIHSTNQAYNFGGAIPPCGTSIVAWERPFGTIGPVGYTSGLVAGYHYKYIPFTDPNGMTPWNASVSSAVLINPANGLSYPVGVHVRTDQEGVNPATYFNPQAVVTSNGLTYFSNLQAEYR